MGYHLNCLDEPVLMAGPKSMQTEFGIPHKLESCELSTEAFSYIQVLDTLKTQESHI